MRSIIFNDEDVQLVLRGKKTQVRKILKFPHMHDTINITSNSIEFCTPSVTFEGFYPEDWLFVVSSELSKLQKFTVQVECPYNIGEVVGVKEPWNYGYVDSSLSKSCFEPVKLRSSGYLGQISNYFYKSDDLNFLKGINIPWKPASSMPQEASRLFLRILNIRAERLQSIKRSDIKLEGFDHRDKQYFGKTYWNKHLSSFRRSLYNWDSNPFVWVINFEVDHILDI